MRQRMEPERHRAPLRPPPPASEGVLRPHAAPLALPQSWPETGSSGRVWSRKDGSSAVTAAVSALSGSSPGLAIPWGGGRGGACQVTSCQLAV